MMERQLNSSGDLHLLAGPYTLNALDELDHRRFETHLPGCESCQADIAGFAIAVDHLAELAAEPAPSHLKTRVLAEVDHTRQNSPLGGRSRSVLRHLPKAAVAAVATVAVISGALFVQSNNRADHLKDVASVYQTQDSQTVKLSSERGDLQVAFSALTRTAVLEASALAELDSAEVYQLWIVSDTGAFPETTFSPEDVNGSLVFALNRTPGPGDAFAVTVEPAGGSDAPTTTPFVISEPL